MEALWLLISNPWVYSIFLFGAGVFAGYTLGKERGFWEGVDYAAEAYADDERGELST
jgi:hypothetical protein